MKLYEVMNINGGLESPAWINPFEIQEAHPTWLLTGDEPPFTKKDAVWVQLRKGGVMVSVEEWDVLKCAANIQIVKCKP